MLRRKAEASQLETLSSVLLSRHLWETEGRLPQLGASASARPTLNSGFSPDTLSYHPGSLLGTNPVRMGGRTS